MGLCKCPKRRVTNLFCFVHRVNVCEDCMVVQHPRCVVQSYLKWLEDSDYDAMCVLCSKSILEGEVVRLLCYDLFHLSCLDNFARSLPQSTAPADFKCPKCKEGLLPQSHVVSPVAEALRLSLRACGWARKELEGQRSLLEASEMNSALGAYSEEEGSLDVDFDSHVTSTPRANHPSASSSTHLQYPPAHSQESLQSQQVAVTMYDQPIVRGGGSSVGVARAVPGGDAGGRGTHSDADDNKYRRKSPVEMFSRWLRQHQRWNLTMDDSTMLMRRYLILVVLGAIFVVSLIVFMTRVGSKSADRDPNLDWRFNPNLRTGD